MQKRLNNRKHSRKPRTDMTPKEKAQELYLKMEATIWGFEVHSDKPKAIAKQCAIIAVDEIIEAIGFCFANKYPMTKKEYWEEVKQEIKKL